MITYKNGKYWATDEMRTAGKAARLQLSADRKIINADGEDLSFITVRVLDEKGVIVPEASNQIQFEISGPGVIVATDNGNAADLTSFQSVERKAFNGLALAIVKTKNRMPGTIKITARSTGLSTSEIIIKAQ